MERPNYKVSGGKLPYASLPAVREAILNRNRASFIYDGECFLVEPHLLGGCQLSSAFVLRAYVLGDQPCWRNFRFHEMRQFQLNEATFTPRPEVEWRSCKIVRIDTSPLTRG